jgi:hypothetical protein
LLPFSVYLPAFAELFIIAFNERTDNKEKSGLKGRAKSGQKSLLAFFCREGCVGAWAGTAIKLLLQFEPAFCRVGSPPVSD